MFFVSETASIVAVALVFSEYISSIWLIIYGQQFDLITIFFLSLMTIWVLTFINLFGVSLSGKVQVFFSIIKIAALGGGLY